MSSLSPFAVALILISCISTLSGVIITIRVTHGWLKVFKEYANIIKKQLFKILLSFIIYPIIVTLYCSIGSIDLILYDINNSNKNVLFSILSLILWLFVVSSFFIFRIVRLIQSDRDKIHHNKQNKDNLKNSHQLILKKYIKLSFILLFILNCLWISLYLIDILYIKIMIIIFIFIVHLCLFILCQKSSISIWLNRDPLKYVYIEREPLYTSLLSQIQCKKLVFRYISYIINNTHNNNNNNPSLYIPSVIKQLCFRYTFVDTIHRESIHNHWQLLHGRKLKKDKVKDLKSISKLLFIEIITGIGMFICSILYSIKCLLISSKYFIILFIIQILLYLCILLTLMTFAMMPTFNSIFYEKICCKFIHRFVEKQVLQYLESKYDTKRIRKELLIDNNGNNNNKNGSSSNRISRNIGGGISQNNMRDNHNYNYSRNNRNSMMKYERDDTILTQTALGSYIITELREIESKQRMESTIHESHSLKYYI